MRNIDLITIHHSGSDNPLHDRIEVIRKWHRDRGFSDVGYHYYINFEGGIFCGRPLSKKGAHTRGFNSKSIGICVGGLDGISPMQKKSLIALVKNLVDIFNIPIENIKRHKDLAPTECPTFDINFLTHAIRKHLE